MSPVTRSLSLGLVILFVGSLLSGAAIELSKEALPTELHDEPVVMEATSPGHPVFAEYMGAHWCGPCHTASANLHSLYGTNGGGGTQSEDFTYISFWESPSSGNPNLSPINRRAHIQSAPGYGNTIPTVVWGDATQGTYFSNGYSADARYQSGGNTKNPSDYSLSVYQTPNGGNMDIEITATYTGTGSTTVYMYAAVTEEYSPEQYSGSPNPHPHHVWKKWLLNPGGTGFESATLTSGSSATKTWSVPISTVRAGGGNTAVDNFLTVAALLNGDHTNHRDLMSAADSNMGPKMDIGVSGLSVTNSEGTESYVRGDTVTLQADVKNTGDLDYTSGGSLEFYYKNGATTTSISTVTIPTLNAASGSSYLTGTATFDTSNLPSNVWSTNFGARLIGLNGDRSSSNNVQELGVNHDRAPLVKAPQVIGSDVVQRGDFVTLLAKGDADDNVDTIDTMSFEVEVSPSGANLWDASIVSGGENVLYRDSAQEGREYIIYPSMTMVAGDYDVRVRSIDSRGQASDWRISSDMFELANGRPLIVADPVPTVMCDLSTKISMDGHVSDPETSLGDLIITSNSPNFVAWHPSTEEIEVIFPYDEIRKQCPLGQKGIEISVDDGGDYSETGELPYGTLLFNVIENGQPRWEGLPIQVIDEGSSGVLGLSPYLSDTDDTGEEVDISTLSIQIIDNSHPDVISVELRDRNLGFQTIDDDVNGETVVTIRASDGEQYSDQTVTIRINPINDAPRLDMTEIEEFSLKSNRQKVINLNSRLTDVDSPQGTYWVNNPQSTEVGSARLVSGDLILNFEEAGVQTVTISTTDGYATNSYEITVNVFDSLPFYVSKTDDGSGHLYVDMVDTYETQTPTASFALTETAPTFTVITVSWTLCNELSGTCDGFWMYDLDMSRSNTGWTELMAVPSPYGNGEYARTNGMRNMDYIGLTVVAVDNAGQEYKTLDTTKWLTTEALPAPADMDDDLLDWYVNDLMADIADVEAQLADDANQADKASLEARLAELNTKFDLACDDPRASCPSDEVQGNGADDAEGSLNMNVILIVIGVLIVAALLGLMFMRNGGQPDEPKWNAEALPIHDAVANSMYGGAADLFQQPVAHVAPVATLPAVAPAPAATLPAVAPAPVAAPLPVTAPAGPPLPPGGLPAGWTMEQWTYYGQEYLNRINHQR